MPESIQLSRPTLKAPCSSPADSTSSPRSVSPSSGRSTPLSSGASGTATTLDVNPEVDDYYFMSCTQNTIRLGYEPCSNQTNTLAMQFLDKLSHEQAVDSRFAHKPGQILYNSGAGTRKTQVKVGTMPEKEHTKTERERRSDHSMMFKEAQLRVSDPVKELVRDNLHDLVPSRNNKGKATKQRKVGKDDLHVEVVVQLDVDAIMIRRQASRIEELEAELRAHQCHGHRYATPPTTANSARSLPQAGRRHSLEDGDDQYDAGRHSPPKRHR